MRADFGGNPKPESILYLVEHHSRSGSYVSDARRSFYAKPTIQRFEVLSGAAKDLFGEALVTVVRALVE